MNTKVSEIIISKEQFLISIAVVQNTCSVCQNIFSKAKKQLSLQLSLHAS